MDSWNCIVSANQHVGVSSFFCQHHAGIPRVGRVASLWEDNLILPFQWGAALLWWLREWLDGRVCHLCVREGLRDWQGIVAVKWHICLWQRTKTFIEHVWVLNLASEIISSACYCTWELWYQVCPKRLVQATSTWFKKLPLRTSWGEMSPGY